MFALRGHAVRARGSGPFSCMRVCGLPRKKMNIEDGLRSWAGHGPSREDSGEPYNGIRLQRIGVGWYNIYISGRDSGGEVDRG